jgi:hypothetical protein
MRADPGDVAPIDGPYPGTVGDFAIRAGMTVAQVVQAFYWMAQAESPADRWAVLNPGCSEDELNAAEVRIQHRLHPLHRLILRLSNGGTIPFVSLSLVGAAVSRESEREWRIAGLYLSPEELEVRPAMSIRQQRPIPALLLGRSLREKYGDAVADKFGLDTLVPFALSGGEEWFCYTRADPAQIHKFTSFDGTAGAHDIRWRTFADFLQEQLVYHGYTTADFVARTQSAWLTLEAG